VSGVNIASTIAAYNGARRYIVSPSVTNSMVRSPPGGAPLGGIASAIDSKSAPISMVIDERRPSTSPVVTAATMSNSSPPNARCIDMSVSMRYASALDRSAAPARNSEEASNSVPTVARSGPAGWAQPAAATTSSTTAAARAAPIESECCIRVARTVAR
jgi:hypothetical protein